MCEGLNSKIETIKRAACGYRNKARFRTAILFHCGKLDMLPRMSACPPECVEAPKKNGKFSESEKEVFADVIISQEAAQAMRKAGWSEGE